MNNIRLPSVCKWLKLSRDQTLDKFNSLNGAFTDGIGQQRFVYIPGTRSDRALIVAHADTVWGNLSIQPDYHNGIVFSAKRNAKWYFTNKWNNQIHRVGIGIGADDRAGCYIAWKLRELGHSILITSGEEIGCIATRRLMNDDHWSKEINNTHSFAVQFDRRGRNDIVFYDVGTKQFAKYVKENTGYKPQEGFSTDIKFLCKDICGVNMSVGYYDEHSADERLSISQLENTLAITKHWLTQPTPKFQLDWKDKFYTWEKPYKQTDLVIPNSMSIKPVERPLTDNKFITCSNNSCGKPFSLTDWFESEFKCPECGTQLK